MLQLKTLPLAALAPRANQWDDLWQRSETRLPSRRFAGVQLWHQAFAPAAELSATIVEDDGRLVAALPLVKDTTRWPLTIFRLPSNCTVGSGDLLIDPDCDVDAVTRSIARHIIRLPGTIVALEGIQIQAERWKSLISALHAEGRAMHVSAGNDVGVVDILHDWDAYTRGWSANHRSSIKRSRAKVEAEGTLQVERLRDPSNEQLSDTLETCFAIENKSWKGATGTSVLDTPGLCEYYQQEARIMRDIGALDLWLLKLNDQIIAFEYCHYAKGTCYSHKISFDPDFERFSPGKVLRSIQLEQYHRDPAAKTFDTLGVLCEAKAKWVTRTYRSSRCFIAIGGHGSNLLLRAYKSLRRLVNRKPKADSGTGAIKPGAAKFLELIETKTTPTSSESNLQRLTNVSG